MSDYISREELSDNLCYGISCNECSFNTTSDGQSGCLLQERIDNLASADVRENVKGEWIKPVQDDGMSDPIYYQVRCSKCGFDIDPQTWYEELHRHGADNFCPNCGADMRGE